MRKLNQMIDMRMLTGFMLAFFLIAFALSQQPVIFQIITMRSDEVETRFVVDCNADESGRMRCNKSEGLDNAL